MPLVLTNDGLKLRHHQSGCSALLILVAISCVWQTEGYVATRRPFARKSTLSSTAPPLREWEGDGRLPVPIPPESTKRRAKPYKRKSIPETEQRVLAVRKERRRKYEEISKEPVNIWSFESLFPNPVVDEESVLKELYRQPDGQDGTTESATLPAKKPTSMRSSQSPWASGVTELQKQMVRFLMNSSPTISKEDSRVKSTTMPSAASLLNATNPVKVNRDLTRLVEDHVYGFKRTSTGEYEYDTSLLSKSSAIQFRDGVRLGHPLRVNGDILTYYGRSDLQHGRVEEAAEWYTRAASIDPRDGRAYLGLSRCARRRRDFALARKWLQIGISRSVSVDVHGNGMSVPDRGANPFLLQTLGRLEEDMGQLAAAESCYKEAVRSRPCHAAAWVSLAQLRTSKMGGSVRVGRACLERAHRELMAAGKPASSFVFTTWGKLEFHQGADPRKARKLFHKALEVDPKCSVAWLQLGNVEAKTENWDAAEACFEKVLEFDGRNSRVLQAYALMETKRPDANSRKAIALFERALAANPRDAGVLQAYGLFVAELGDLDSARSLLRRGTEINKRHAAVWQAWGVLETRHGYAEEARRIFQEGIWACGQLTGGQSGGYRCARLWQAWGVLEAKEGDYAAAKRCFSRALDADGRNVPALTAWATMEEKMGQLDNARMIYERALRCFSSGSEEKVALWRCYELMEQRVGNSGAARNIFERQMRESMSSPEDALEGEGLEPPPKLEAILKSEVADFNEKKKRKSEFEVVRWQNTGGEVWLVDDEIESKIPIQNRASKPNRLS